jgi:hypothetical protein
MVYQPPETHMMWNCGLMRIRALRLKSSLKSLRLIYFILISFYRTKRFASYGIFCENAATPAELICAAPPAYSIRESHIFPEVPIFIQYIAFMPYAIECIAHQIAGFVSASRKL